MQGGQQGVADQVILEGQDGRQLIPAAVELDAHEADIGHPFDQMTQHGIAAGLDHLHGFRFCAAHTEAPLRSKVKAPVAVATGRSSSSSVAVTRTKATDRVTW